MSDYQELDTLTDDVPVSVSLSIDQSAPKDPATLGYPPTLPIEVALRTAPLPVIMEEYNLTRDDWDRLREDPVFIKDLTAVVETLKTEGMSFRLKARLQSEALLTQSFRMITMEPYDKVSAAVKADLLKHTHRIAGLDASKDQGKGEVVPTMNIQINLG